MLVYLHSNMKKFLLALALVLTMVLAGCGKKQAVIHEPTSAELDLIRHTQINDSINQLDTIKILGSLFMGMRPCDYNILKQKTILPVNIGQLSFETVDTSMYHNTVHNIILKSHSYNYVSNMDGMAQYAVWGEHSFYDVIQLLSVKYGRPSWIAKMSETNNNGEQFGMAQWDFDKFSVNYEHRQYANLRSDEYHINAEITYSIPRIETPEEKQRTDSIINAWKQEQKAEEQRNNKAIQSL